MQTNFLFQFFGISNHALMVTIQVYTNKCTILNTKFLQLQHQHLYSKITRIVNLFVNFVCYVQR